MQDYGDDTFDTKMTFLTNIIQQLLRDIARSYDARDRVQIKIYFWYPAKFKEFIGCLWDKANAKINVFGKYYISYQLL